MYDVHRMSVLGKSPKEATARIRAALEPGFYICRSGKKKVRSLHQLGKCYLLPGVGCMDYTSSGNALPKKSEYDRVCRLCARYGVREGEDSSATVSSSSSSESSAHHEDAPSTSGTKDQRKGFSKSAVQDCSRNMFSTS